MTETDHFELQLLDAVDITRNPGAQAESLKSNLPALQAKLNEAATWVADSLKPVPPGSPMDDTWDDQIWFERAMGQSGYVEKKKNLEAAQSKLEQLERSENKGRSVSSWILLLAHRYLKSIGLENRSARENSGPICLGGKPLAEIIWQARNQDQHYDESRELSVAVVTCFKALVPCNPILLGLTVLPTSDTDWQALLHQQSWAQEILKLIGWTSSNAVIAGLRSITP